jgi:glutamate-1-semialdehyde 2,1-aminomutase
VFGPAPDFFVLGKPIAGGIPCAVFGFTAEIADRLTRLWAAKEPGHSGLGTTLSAIRWRWRPCAPTSSG